MAAKREFLRLSGRRAPREAEARVVEGLHASQVPSTGRRHPGSRAQSAPVDSVGAAEAAAEWFRRGVRRCEEGRFDLAIEAFSKALSLDSSAATIDALGCAQWGAGNLNAAAESFARAARMSPRCPEHVWNLARVLQAARRDKEAARILQRLLRRRFSGAAVHAALGESLHRLGRHSRAVALLRQALRLDPGSATAHARLATSLAALEDHKSAIKHSRAAVRLKPDFSGAHAQLGASLFSQKRFSEALACYRDALRLRPDSPLVYNNLAGCHLVRGELSEAVACFRRALAIQPDFHQAHSNLLFALNYLPDEDPRAIFEAHQDYGRRLEAVHEPLCYPATRRSPGRRLRIGYVSTEFARQPVSFFLEPILRAHDRRGFETFCYSCAVAIDDTTRTLQRLANHWRNVARSADDEIVRRIEQDRIDILVDLAGHTGNNRLGVFWRKPAPIQITYLGYPNTTGLAAIDFRISDAWADPVGSTEHFHTEELLRLPRCFLCYQPPREAPAVRRRSGGQGRGITFGCFNVRPKINAELVSLWAAVLRRTPGSRLLLKTFAFQDKEIREELGAQFRRFGVAREALILRPPAASFRQHLALYGGVDIALDSYPYNGTTTTCEALWMGAPVITLAGRTHASRVGASLLAAVGLEACVAHSPHEYVDIATRWAADAQRLAELRLGLRERMAASPLTDGPGFTRALESAYRGVWRRWVANSVAAGAHA